AVHLVQVRSEPLGGPVGAVEPAGHRPLADPVHDLLRELVADQWRSTRWPLDAQTLDAARTPSLDPASDRSLVHREVGRNLWLRLSTVEHEHRLRSITQATILRRLEDVLEFFDLPTPEIQVRHRPGAWSRPRTTSPAP